MVPLHIGSTAPDVVVVDEHEQRHALRELRGGPAIVILVEPAAPSAQPSFQQLTIEGETVPVLASSDVRARADYGVDATPAIFVVSETGTILWRDTHSLDQARLRSDPAARDQTRREFIATMLAASVAATFEPAATASAAEVEHQTIDVEFEINGRSARLSVDPRVTLLDALRERTQLTGTKKGCDHGQCGACTVHVDGRRVLSCLTLVASVDGSAVTTIEGLSDGARLHPVQRAFIEADGFQCGYCTPGQIMSAVALLREPCGPEDEDVRECMSGNLCRCGAYPGIVTAIQSVRGNRS